MSDQNKTSAFQMIADIDGDLKDLLKVNVPQSVPILAVRNLVLFPGVVSPILIGRDSSKKLIQKAEKTGQVIGIVCQREPDVDFPLQEDLYEIGVYGKVMKQLTLPNGNITTIVQALGRFRLKTIIKSEPYLEGIVDPIEDFEPDKKDREFRTAMEDLRNMVTEYINISEEIPDEATFAIKNISNNIMVELLICLFY